MPSIVNNAGIDSEERELENFLFGGEIDLSPIKSVVEPAFYIDKEAEDTEFIKLDAPTAWVDDDELLVDIQTKKRLRKIKENYEEVSVSAAEYESRLRSQFEKINPTPQWAQLDNDKNIDMVMQSTKCLTAKGKSINPERLDVLRLTDVNQSARSQVS